jgi:colanic acid biosynthesis glycosyl transferase WcaI
MRILIVSQYFWPENFRINEISEFLKKENIEVDVLTGTPNYPEGKIFSDFKDNPDKYNSYYGTKIYRIPIIPRGSGSLFNLFFNYSSFLLSSTSIGFFKLRKKKYDYILTFGTSPITVALTSLFFSKIKKARTIIWVLDLWPDILKDLDIINNRIILKILTKITNFTYKNHDIILAQSESFLRQIIKHNKNTIYFPSWPETIKTKKLSNDLEDIKLDKFKNHFKIVFTGNIGQAQDFDRIIKLAKILKEENVIFIIVGKGRKFEYFKKVKLSENINNIIFMGNYPLEKMNYFHEIADALILTLNSGEALNKTIPGKLSTYMMAGKPIIGVIDGEAKDIINFSKSGICLDFNDDEYIKKVKTFVNLDKQELEILGNNAKTYTAKFFNKQKILKDLINVLSIKKVSKTYKFNIIKDAESIPYNKNFVLSGLNLAFLGYWSAKKINLYKNLFHWPDGLFKNIIFSKDIKKIPGRTLVKQMKINKEIKNIIVAGNCSETSKKYLDKKFKNVRKTYIPLPFGKAEDLAEFIPEMKKDDLIFLTLPTPKQEQVAEFLVSKFEHYKVICIGAGIEMASGNEKAVPEYLENYGFEAIYRLKTDTIRRIKRLTESLFFLLKALFSKKLSKIEAKIYEKDEL